MASMRNRSMPDNMLRSASGRRSWLWESVPEGIVRHRRWIAAGWLLAGITLAPLARHAESKLEVAARVVGSESATVDRVLVERLKSPFARYAVLVASGLPAPATDEGRNVLGRIVASLDSVDGVTRTFSYLDVADTLFVGADGAGTYVLVGLDPGQRAADALVPVLRTASGRLTTELTSQYPGVALRWTGDVALNHDLRATSADDGSRAERRVLPVTLLLLLVAFGTVVAAVLPLVAGGFAIALTLGAAVVIAAHWPLSILLQNIVSMIGLGLGIDYALLIVSRFREALASGVDRETAAIDATRHAGLTVAASGAAVAIGFTALCFVPLNELSSIGVGGVIVVAVSVLLATTLLPALLVWIGPRVNAARVFRGRTAKVGASYWRRWGEWVTQRPISVLVVAATPMVALGWQARRLSTDLPRGEWLPARMESAQALAELRRMHRSAVTGVVRLVVELPADRNAYTPAGRGALLQLNRALLVDERVARVRSIVGLVAPLPLDSSSAARVPADVRRSLISDDARTVLVEALPQESVAFNDLTAYVRDLRHRAADLTGMNDARVSIGGMAAFNADYSDVIAGRLPRLIALIVIGTLIALFIAFRSVMIPIKAVLLNLLSVVAAFGAVVLVFQDGHGASALGMSAPVDGVFPAVPIVVFCIIFGLSMDYEVFLVARVREARGAIPVGSNNEREAVVAGLAATGGIITSAAAIMIVVFAAFAMGDFIMMKILGFALATAVFLDATLVRVAIGPALLQLAGRWNWWPGDRPARSSRVEAPAVATVSKEGEAWASVRESIQRT